MARHGVTYQQVAAAADSIVAAGENPTIKRVHAELGSGSHGTIHKHLTTWRNAAPVQERKAPELPAELQASIVRELERQAAESRADAEKRLMQVQSEADELAAAGEKLEAEMDALAEQNQALSDDNQRLTALAGERHDEIESIKAELERERKAAEEARIQVAQGRNKIESLEQQLSDQAAKLTEAQNDTKMALSWQVTAEKESAVSTAKLESEQANSADLRARLADTQQQLKELGVEFKALESKHSAELKQAQENVNSKLELSAKELAETNSNLVYALGQVAELERKLASANAEIAELSKPAKRQPRTAQKKEG